MHTEDGGGVKDGISACNFRPFVGGQFSRRFVFHDGMAPRIETLELRFADRWTRKPRNLTTANAANINSPGVY